MTRTEILMKMATLPPRRIWRTMQLGGNARQLMQMEEAGLLKSQRRYGGTSYRQRDWFLTEEQHAALTFLELAE